MINWIGWLVDQVCLQGKPSVSVIVSSYGCHGNLVWLSWQPCKISVATRCGCNCKMFWLTWQSGGVAMSTSYSWIVGLLIRCVCNSNLVWHYCKYPHKVVTVTWFGCNFRKEWLPGLPGVVFLVVWCGCHGMAVMVWMLWEPVVVGIGTCYLPWQPDVFFIKTWCGCYGRLM
jgi:hypothetical protein